MHNKAVLELLWQKSLDEIWTVSKLHNDMNTNWLVSDALFTFHESSILEAWYPCKLLLNGSFFKTQRASAYSEREHLWNCWLLFIFYATSLFARSLIIRNRFQCFNGVQLSVFDSFCTSVTSNQRISIRLSATNRSCEKRDHCMTEV